MATRTITVGGPDHNALGGRTEADAHPVSAITNAVADNDARPTDSRTPSGGAGVQD